MTRLLLVLLLAGCATAPLEPVTVEKGRGLAVVAVQTPEIIRMVCVGENKLACVPLRKDTTGLSIFLRTPPPEWGIDQKELALLTHIVAHELCHGVHQTIVRTYTALAPHLRHPDSPDLMALIARFERDPCHDEDGGVLHR